MEFDVIIVGAGPAGYFMAYELVIKNPQAKILLLEKGLSIYDRHCLIKEGKVTKCPSRNDGTTGCYPHCAITSGFGGAGAFSDGKFNVTAEFGGWLDEYITNDKLLELINYVDSINLKFGATPIITDPTTNFTKEIEKRALAVGLKLLRSKVRHLGTEENINILKNIYNFLKDKIEIKFKTPVDDLIIEDNIIKGVTSGDNDFYAKYVFLGVGRDGSNWISEMCHKYNIRVINNQVDVGVRVETNNIVMSDINDNLYEGKFVYRTSEGTMVRTFCSNPAGYVVVENNSGVILANGHAYQSKDLGSTNTNFALLVSHKFSEPFTEPNKYAEEVSHLANKLSLGSVIVQRYGDLKKGRRSTDKRIQEGFVTPTLKEAVPGDLGLVLPYKTMKSIIEMIEALDHVTPGIANEHTLFYGVEAKFYSARPEISNEFETKIKNLFVGGDGAGVTRSLAQAGANGIFIADIILKRMN